MEHQSSSPGAAGIILSAFGFIVSLASAQQMVSIVAGLMSIIAACFAIRYYIKKSK